MIPPPLAAANPAAHPADVNNRQRHQARPRPHTDRQPKPRDRAEYRQERKAARIAAEQAVALRLPGPAGDAGDAGGGAGGMMPAPPGAVVSRRGW
jgi:hypothetical protein